MIQYPLKFEMSALGRSGIQQTWASHVTQEKNLVCAIPPEFEGPGGGYSPEDLFGLAVMNCFIATFKVIAEKSKASFQEIKAQGELIVDRDEKGAPWMSEMKISIELILDSGADPQRFQHLLEKTASSCLVARSIRTNVQFSFQVR